MWLTAKNELIKGCRMYMMGAICSEYNIQNQLKLTKNNANTRGHDSKHTTHNYLLLVLLYCFIQRQQSPKCQKY